MKQIKLFTHRHFNAYENTINIERDTMWEDSISHPTNGAVDKVWSVLTKKVNWVYSEMRGCEINMVL